MLYKNIRFKPSFYLFLSLALIVLASGCSDIKKATYFNDLNDQKLVAANTLPDPVIQQNDLLSITVSSLNPQASALFNAPNESTPQTNQATSYGNNTLTVGYLVSLNGDIQFPVLGTIHAEGLTKTQLNQLLVKQLTDRKLLVDPIVTIRFLNYRVSVLGEVARPGIYTSPSEKLTIMEALGLAGDMTIYGKKDNVLIIREVSPGEKTIARLNLNSKSVLTSPYYYLKSNDVIYVEPIKDKLARERNQYILPIIFSLTTLVLVVVDRFN